MSMENRGQASIRENILDRGWCTDCGACVGLCPYQAHYRDHTVIVHDCDRESGRCHDYCPRTPADLDAIRKSLFEEKDITPELGPIKGLYLTRAADPEVRHAAQHGGTVSALIRLALERGLIEAAVLADRDETLASASVAVERPDDVAAKAGSKFVVSPTVAGFNRLSLTNVRSIGVVATPCQALALAKMRAHPAVGDTERTAKLKLTVGLFCGWALSLKELKTALVSRIGDAEILGLDIPPSKHACMEVRTGRGSLEIPLKEIEACVRPACRFCDDMTCEFADLSVGAARSPEGWDVDRGWNQVIVRSTVGRDLLDLAREKGVLEFRDVPAENLDKLKRASLKKKAACEAKMEAAFGGRTEPVSVGGGCKSCRS